MVLKMTPSTLKKSLRKYLCPQEEPLSGTHVSCAFQIQQLLPANSCRDHCNSQLSAWRPQILLSQALRVDPLWPGTAFVQRLFSHQKKSNFHLYWRVLSNVKGVHTKKSHTWNGLSRLHSHLPVALKTQPFSTSILAGQASSLSFHSFLTIRRKFLWYFKAPKSIFSHLISVDLLGLPWWLSGKESACKCRRRRSILGRKIPWRRVWEPNPVFLPEKFHLQRSLQITCIGWQFQAVYNKQFWK